MPSRTCRRFLALLVVAAACTSTTPEPPPATGANVSRTASPDATGTTGAPVTTAPTPSPAPDGRTSVEIAPPRGESFLVRGSYPRAPSACVDPEPPRLLARYPGRLSIDLADDGNLSLTVTVSFDRYLQGIAEVPASWPRAALEAQAIAARSYALATTGWQGEEGEPLPTPICATTACQVYRGIPVPFDPVVRRWYAAVRSTDGQVLLHDGRPAETVYFSTSNGQTYGNEDVFGSAPLPYLRPVVEHDDGASPVSRWSVRVPFEDLATFLRAAGEWPGARPITGIGLDGGAFVLEGGRRPVELDPLTFRTAVNAWAPCLEPDRYPPATARGRLPLTIPSRWLTVTSEADAAVFTGRGWGHGAGMVQWGAYGKAVRGVSAPDILAHYYGGLRPEPYPEPGTIHVEVASGLTSLRVFPSAPGAVLDGEVLGADRVTISGGDAVTVTVDERR